MRGPDRESIFLLPAQVTIQDTRITLMKDKPPVVAAANRHKNTTKLNAKFFLREAGTWMILDASFGLRVM
jgi:hypothetical protein